ncbi:unnamed protein product [Mytilus edulis]|uniref:Uncharacterized protein n=1 Tax=Mytilus edulis TaxID=6550 RepID=A0A8S3TGL2_MYTED|nr:unnamed protein product [Mytilus edulis]
MLGWRTLHRTNDIKLLDHTRINRYISVVYVVVHSEFSFEVQREWEMHRKYSENKDLAVELTNIKQSGYKMFATMCFMTGAYIIYLSCSQSPLTESLSYLLVLVMFSRGIIVAVFMCFLEEHCKCWDGVYAVEGSTTTDSESLSSRNSSHPSHYGHHTVLPNHGIISM